MTLVDALTALLSALLHAGWNAGVKAAARPVEAMAAQITLSGLMMVPLLLYTGLPQIEALPWMAASTVLSLTLVTAMLKGYETGGFGVVYPFTRAISVLLVVPLSAAIAGDRLAAPALGGIALMACALALLAVGSGRSTGLAPVTLLWIAIGGVVAAVYVLCDSQGVRRAGNPLAYGCAVSLVNAAGMSWRQRRLGSPWRLISRNATVAFPAAVASTVSYLAIVWVWSHAPVAPSSALRDTSAVFALLISIYWLGEPFTRTRVAAVLLAAAAVPLLRLA